MRNLLALIGAVVVAFVGLGWYLGWYSFALSPSTDGKQRIQVDVDTKKIVDDAKRGGQALGNLGQSGQGSTTAPTTKHEFVGPPVPPEVEARQKAKETPPMNRIPGPLQGPGR